MAGPVEVLTLAESAVSVQTRSLADEPALREHARAPLAGTESAPCRTMIHLPTVGPMAHDEPTCAARLLDAQAKAERL
ncbi:hypothetical protein [Streptomyces mirabilis]